MVGRRKDWTISRSRKWGNRFQRLGLTPDQVSIACGIPTENIMRVIDNKDDAPLRMRIFFRLFTASQSQARRDVIDQLKEVDGEWRPVPGYPAYEVSRTGVIRREGRILKPTRMPSGHHKISLYNGKRHNGISRGLRTQVHRVVALAYLGPAPPGKPLVRHLSGIADDNRVENLAWGDTADNVADRLVHARLRDPYILHTVVKPRPIIRRNVSRL